MTDEGFTVHGWDEKATRAAVAARSGGICENCHQRRATDKHHRISRGVGGWWSPANVLDLCRRCHDFITGNPLWAKRFGLSLDSHRNPNAVEVWPAVGAPFWPSDDVTMPGESDEQLAIRVRTWLRGDPA